MTGQGSVINQPPATERSELKPTAVLKPVPLQMKQDFIVKALSDHRFLRRGKTSVKLSGSTRSVALSSFDGAVLACVVFHCHPARGYSFIGIRKIAELMSKPASQNADGGWKSSPSGVGKSINKLIALGAIAEIGEGRKNKAQRLAPNWEAYLDLSVYSQEVDDPVHSHEADADVHSHRGPSPSSPMGEDEKERKRNINEAKGTGRASPACATSPPVRGIGRSSARRSSGSKTRADTVSILLAKRKSSKEGRSGK
jgi:hypothetical protein